MAEFYKKRLSNGVTVLFEKRSPPVVSVSSSVKFGSLYEGESWKGICHFMEHLMFKGTKTRSQEDIAREVEKKGGVLNAYTGEEVTSYWSKLPSKHFSSGASICSDLILNPKFDKDEFEKEKNVIIEEIKMYHDNPRLYVLDKIKEMLYKRPFGMSIAGKEEIIRGASLTNVKKIFQNKYTSDSMIFTAVGNVDFNEICEAVSKFPKTMRNNDVNLPVKKNQESTEKRKGIDQTHFTFGFHAPSLADKSRYAYELAAAYLFDGMSSRLFQEIREKRGLAYAVKGDFDLGAKYGYCVIYAGTQKDKTEEIKKIIVKELKNLKEMKLKDFEECKEQLIGSKKVEEEDSSTAMNSLLIEELASGAEEHYEYDSRINSVKLDEVKNIKLKDFSSFTLVPG